MTENDFRELLARAEGETLDFKVEGYHLPAARNDFIKDVLSMANTPRDKPAHIVLGVHWTAESGSAVEGLASQFDDAELGNAFGHGRVQPNPRYLYTPLTYEGKKVGVLEIPVERGGPYTPTKDYEGLQAGAVYYRRGTQNERAVGPELRRIFEWFHGGDPGVPAEDARGSWVRFLDAAHRFEEGTTYILAADRLASTSAASLQALGLPPWRAVIDFDPNSDATGLLSSVVGSLGHKRVVHRVVRGEYRVQPEPGTHWFFARGLAGRHETLARDDHTSWLKSYKQEVAKQLGLLAAAVSPSPVVAVLLWSEVGLRKHLSTLIEELHGAFGEAVEVVVVSADGPSFEALAEEAGATFVRMHLRNLCGGIAVHYSDALEAGDERCVLPTPSGAPVELAHDDSLWLSEDLELVHRSVGLRGADEAAEFRRGAEVSWRNLQLRHDCERDLTQLLQSQVQADRGRPQTVRVNLYHAPGAGGTTVSRRVAWDLHMSVPVAILRRCAPRDTAERISKVAALTGSSVVVVIDGGQHSERDVDDVSGQYSLAMLM